ncbi:hypothetical protein BDV3_005268 [Batrachochytrium dendrobatidis]|nr:hypothetical protein O5D80_003317 [Batrachochytrium dendrobatidis]KAK5667127.1 hypothetical protein QVD99_006338 [Batrachochytrium dendrobatidis]
MVNLASTILRWSLGIVFWGVISFFARRCGLIRFSALLQVKPTMALWGLFRVEDAIGWHDSARSRYFTFPLILLLFGLFLVSQVSEVFLLAFVSRGQGFAPSNLTPSLTHSIASIGINLTYYDFGGLAEYLPCNDTTNWWDTDYRLMVASLAGIPKSPVSIPSANIQIKSTNTLQTSFLDVPLQESDISSMANSILTTTELMTSIPLSLNIADPIYTNARIFFPVTDAVGHIVYNRSHVMQQIIWPDEPPLGMYWQAEVQLTLNSGYTLHPQTGMKGYPEMNMTWLDAIFPFATQLPANQSIQVDQGSTNVFAFGDYMCLTGNTAAGDSAGIVIMPRVMDRVLGTTSGLQYIVINSNGTSVAYPHLYLSQSVVLNQVMRCRAYANPTLGSPFRWWLASCTETSTECGTPIFQGTIDPVQLQPVGIMDFQTTVINTRQCDTACLERNTPTISKQPQYTLPSTLNTILVSFYIPYESTVAWVAQSNVLHFESSQCFPGVCTQSGLCSGWLFPLWLLASILGVVVAAALILAWVEDLSRVVLHGFLQTTGAYGYGLHEGKGVFRSDTLCYLHTMHREAFVGVRSWDTLYEQSRFMADPNERMVRGRETVKVSSLGAGRKLAKLKNLHLE